MKTKHTYCKVFFPVLLLILFFLNTTAYAENKKIILDESTLAGSPVGLSVYYLEDKSGKMTFDQASAKDIADQYKSSQKENLSFGFNTSAFWVRFTAVNNDTVNKKWYLDIAFPLLDYVELYIPEKNGYSIRYAGDTNPFSKREYDHENFVFKIDQLPGESIYYIRVKTTGSVNIPLAFWSEATLTSNSFNNHIIQGIFYGILLIMLIYNFVIFLSSRDPNYLTFVLFTSSLILTTLVLNGLGFRFLWPNTLWLCDTTPLFIQTTSMTGILFTITYLRTKKNEAIIHKILLFLFALSTIVALSWLVIPYSLAIAISTRLLIVITFILLIVSIIFAFRRNRASFFYFPGALCVITGAMLIGMKNAGIIPSNFFTVWGLQIGFTLQIALFSFGLADKLNTLKNELAAINLHLEDLVAERTSELEAARDALWGEMELAKKIQSVLVPHRPVIEGYEISVSMTPADEVGGDYYDIINVENRDWVVIGDVSGHGVPAGLIMMMVQTAIQVVVKNSPEISPSDLLISINKTISSNILHLGENKYMTMTVLATHRDGQFIFSGLHLDILLYRAATSTVESIETRGMWIGVMPDITGMLDNDLFAMLPGDVVLLYSDGVTEAVGTDGKMFSDERLISTLRNNGTNSADEIQSAILREMKEFTKPDDVTLVVLKRR